MEKSPLDFTIVLNNKKSQYYPLRKVIHKKKFIH